ncbi:MAG: peptidoglycan DD-metalloendopeptidase family protein [Longilinea sp.]|nr:peptidoglycan DD-metalloendopeptidase family protein [Longilinea sp.]MCA1953814.1 peptidoglycan DD-metalloendopeptidase family protein [Anaerolinea sp.]
MTQAWEGLVRLGLGEVTLRVGAGLVSLALILLVIWVMSTFYLQGKLRPSQNIDEMNALALAQIQPTPTPQPVLPSLSVTGMAAASGVPRLALLHTILPAKPRYDSVVYTVQPGDTIFGIAERFGLKPETILFGNYDVLADNPHFLQPGQELKILPTNGLIYRWNNGDNLKKVAEFYGVTPEVIINWPGNHLDPATIGDYAFPNIAAGTELFVPGGVRTFITWSAPRITRRDPAVAKILGPGYCGTVSDGAIGQGTFVWPSTNHFLSGYDYSPATNHYGIDVDGDMGSPIYAVDGGVVVYSGWNDYGYGNVIVIDHGTGWQSLYAHLDQINVACGASVYQGQLIGLMGSTGRSTGPHLHFELRTDHAYVNPWDYLP